MKRACGSISMPLGLHATGCTTDAERSELVLLAHDVMRDEASAKQVIEAARSIKTLDPHEFRAAVETVFERTMAVAQEVWDDNVKRSMSLRAARSRCRRTR